MSYFLRVSANVPNETFEHWHTKRISEVQESKERLHGSLSNLAIRKACTQEPRRDLVYAEYSVQEQERLLALYEYRLWCVQNRLGYSVIVHY